MSKSNVVKPLTGFRKYISIKVKHFIDGYGIILSKRFPSTYRMLQVFTFGTKNFSSDVLKYMKVSKDLAFNRPISDISYREIDLYMQTPKDLRKMIPFLLISSVPFAQYVTIPIAFWFPRQFLSSHYWSIEQRNRFAIQDHTKKLYYYRPVFRHLQKRLSMIKSESGKCLKAFSKLGSGTHPTVPEILELSPFFENEPYHLDSLSHTHLIGLCKIHGVNLLPGKKIRLKNHIYFIKELDSAWMRESNDDKNLEDYKKACFQRGLNPVNLSRDEMLQWLESWIRISQMTHGMYEIENVQPINN